jgi:hypothetical protein
MPNLKFYFSAKGQTRSAMTHFLINCYFNGFCKGRKEFVSTLRYAKKLHTMRHSANTNSALCRIAPSSDSALCCIGQSYFFKCVICDSALCQLVWNSSQNVLLSTQHYAAQRRVDSMLCLMAESQYSVLCRIAQSCDSALCRTERSHNSALCGIVRSLHIFVIFSANLQPYAKIF